METDHNTQHNESATVTDTESGTAVAQATPSGAAWVWTAIVLTLLAWTLLMICNGYIAITAGAVATAMSIVALCRSHGAMHRLSVTALIASLVLVVVLGAFIMVIKVGLG